MSCRRIVLYLSGPISSTNGGPPASVALRHSRIEAAREAAIKLWKAGFTPICPHLNTLDMDDEELTPEDFIEGDIELVKRSNLVVLLPGWQMSTGAQKEVAAAKVYGVPTYPWVELLRNTDHCTTAAARYKRMRMGLLGQIHLDTGWGPTPDDSKKEVAGEFGKKFPSVRIPLYKLDSLPLESPEAAEHLKRKDITSSATGAERSDTKGRGRYDFLTPQSERRIARVMEANGAKYPAHNWEKGMPMSRFLDSLIRHLNQYRMGERNRNIEVGDDHLAQAAWNLLGLMFMEEEILAGRQPSKYNDIPAYGDGSTAPYTETLHANRAEKYTGESCITPTHAETARAESYKRFGGSNLSLSSLTADQLLNRLKEIEKEIRLRP